MTHIDADVVIVGAGPAGSTAAAHLAQAGFEVALLEKASFPRDKICGDALTPRAVRETQRLGIPTRAADGWHPNRGLRLIGAGHRLEIDWPDVPGMPDHGLTRPRMKLDADLAGFAAACDLAGFFATASVTISMIAMGALSPLRGPIFVMRV